MSVTSVITVIVLLLLFFYIAYIYNTLVSLKSRFQNAFSQVEVQLKRRYDLIPNLVETSKAYLAHERETLEAVTNARNTALTNLKTAATDPSNRKAIHDLSSSEGLLTNALGKLNIAVEAYPELKASETIHQLSEELTTTENRVAFARQAFNDSVTEYNIHRQSFPTIVFSGLFGHGSNADLLEFADSAEIQEAPKVSF